MPNPMIKVDLIIAVVHRDVAEVLLDVREFLLVRSRHFSYHVLN